MKYDEHNNMQIRIMLLILHFVNLDFFVTAFKFTFSAIFRRNHICCQL